MEFCMETRALKSSLRNELATKSTQQAISEDFFAFNASAVVSSDQDFSVDCFLDFSNGEFKDGYAQEEEEKDSLSVSSQDRVDDDFNSNSSSFSDSFLSSELAVPVSEDD